MLMFGSERLQTLVVTRSKCSHSHSQRAVLLLQNLVDLAEKRLGHNYHELEGSWVWVLFFTTTTVATPLLLLLLRRRLLLLLLQLLLVTASMLPLPAFLPSDNLVLRLRYCHAQLGADVAAVIFQITTAILCLFFSLLWRLRAGVWKTYRLETAKVRYLWPFELNPQAE